MFVINRTSLENLFSLLLEGLLHIQLYYHMLKRGCPICFFCN
uniref:Uncharacterized protein n=1 Tax=Arundo donax TaxID=35708 RepID=A0A0A9UK55_ARUDO